MESLHFEVRANIKFLTKLEWQPSRIIEALQQVCGGSAPSKSVIYEWIKHFKKGREDIKDDGIAVNHGNRQGNCDSASKQWKKAAESRSRGLLICVGSRSIQHLQLCKKLV
ncbi:hypothetical protein M513_05851 [Trichuris suis]|uniref:Mos1 transposase HTH domain-containing protein n=1 Tax=Trichuris suis TaxID=68888 RepID=A0A085M824_9BILA|nr:hypothetical protein M513_05851 [Trichuris suis]